MSFLLDENVPVDFGKELKNIGYKVETVNIKKLKGMSDKQVLEYAYKNKQTIISFDSDFCGFKELNHYGIIKISGKISNPLDVIIELAKQFNKSGFENLFVQVDQKKAFVEYKVFSKKKKIFKGQFRRMPIHLKSLLGDK